MKNLRDQTIKRLITFLCFLVLCLIALGGAVRAMDAGLSCPDWPLCFGKFVPDFHPQVYFEFVHRLIAGLVAVLTVVLGTFIFKKRQYPSVAKKLIIFLGVILVTQIVMGGLTVLKLLHFGVVTAHLALGMLFFSTLLVLHFHISNRFPKRDRKTPKGMLVYSVIMAGVVFFQIVLGGLVSSNYAGLACPDFPLCRGQWVPTLEGNVGLQVLHRLGAYTTFLIIYLLYIFLRTQHRKSWIKKEMMWNSRFALSFVLMQLVVGMSNVLFKTPPLLTVLHLVVAGIVLLFALRVALYSFYEAAKD